MYTKDAIEVFGSRAALVKALKGARHRSAIYQWQLENLIPMGAATLLARKSDGKLKVNPKLYEDVRKGKLEDQQEDRVAAADAREDAALAARIAKLKPLRKY